MTTELEECLTRLTKFYSTGQSDPAGVHTVTFQPLLTRTNEDRVITENWTINEEKWLFLAVCDGHGGTTTASYTAKNLPGLLRSALTDALGRNGFDCANGAHRVSEMLRKVVMDFDESIGADLREICPGPSELSEEDALRLISEHREIIERACFGTTLSCAIVNITRKYMWAVAVGDSTVALSSVDKRGKRSGHRFVKAHTLQNPREYLITAMRHPSSENGMFRAGTVLDFLAMTRAIGDFFLKYDSSYLTHLFRYLDTTFGGAQNVPLLSKTPPYVTARPSVKYEDLRFLWKRKPILILYTDGVDHLIKGERVFHPETPCDADPCRLVISLLEKNIDESVEKMLGHKPISTRDGRNENRAVNLLVNLVGGCDTERLKMAMDQDKLADIESFYMDDTSIIICDISKC